jgi:flagellar motor protein MotB
MEVGGLMLLSRSAGGGTSVACLWVDASRLTSSGFGAAKPIGSNDTPNGRAANRCVEFLTK